ncbi:Protein kinase-like domain-containing protein [Cynara cardunculus var. scolymus]|uniref:Protein kinase-like domain-containing protein n=1 Tax=Cynara cardunculus var. scolymus TaxID=59895 RepID=A0A103YK28_CYNCS|nr:Protein kinase-like domain-containing protein [Cynara cardunculus var. scolymus]
MAAILASNSCYCRDVQLVNQGRTTDNLSFSRSISTLKLDRHECKPKIERFHRFHVEMQQTESPMKFGSNGQPAKLDTNGQPVKLGANGKPVNLGANGQPVKLGKNGQAITMVPTSEVVKNKPLSKQTAGVVNGSTQVVNGTSLVKRTTTPAPVKSVKVREPTGFLPSEELKVLPSDESFSWANENYNSVQRSIDVWSFVLSLRVRVLFDNAKWAYPGGFTEDKQKSRRRKTAAWLRECVLQLGPTFIKLGQLSSTRSDLFPREFVDELAKLQDRVPAFSPAKAKSFIEKELGAPVNVIFKEFEERPIAAASLGQVHRAILHNGEKVVIKVQRPGLKKLFDIDLRNLKLVAEYFQRSESLGGPTRDWIGIYDECAKILYEEIDYINEGKNADKFRRDFRNIKWVRVPQVFWDYTAQKVLTLEYVPGIKINNLDAIKERGFSRSQISSHAIESYLIQVENLPLYSPPLTFIECKSFFHADPHPGNLAIDVDESLIYYDFGMMGEIKSFTRERLMDLFYAVYEKDAKKVMNSLISLEALQPTGDMSAVRRSVQFFLDNLLSQSPDQETTLAAIGEVSRIGYLLVPDFSFVKIAAPYAQELLDLKQQRRSGTQLVQEIQKQANDSERAARKATILQMATLYTVIGGTLVNIGVTFSSQGSQLIANGSFVAAGVFIALLLRSMQRVKKLDKFEKMI